jgi:hypothetical protein
MLKQYIYKRCTMSFSFTSWSQIYNIFNIHEVVVEKHQFFMGFDYLSKATLSILKIL